MHIIQPPLLDFEAFISDKSNNHFVMVLEALDVEKLIATVVSERWTRKKGYSIRGMWSALIAGVLKLPILEDPRRHPPLPRETKKWHRLYRLRSAVERVNSRVKELLGLGRITVRGIAKVTARSLLSLLVMLAAAVAMVQCHRLKELRVLVI